MDRFHEWMLNSRSSVIGNVIPLEFMIVNELQRDDATEPVWDSVGIHGCDFRPHFDGDLHNVFTTIYPLESKAETEVKFMEIAFEIANWILNNKSRFSDGDRFQIIVGWPLDVRPTGRQCIKTGGTFDDLRRLVNDRTLISIRDGWHKTVFDAEIAG